MVSILVATATSGGWDRVMLDDAASADGAVCLDGTAAGFYYSNATADVDSKSWEIYFQGGGWCYDKEDCWGRSSTGLGSSKSWGPTSSIGGRRQQVGVRQSGGDEVVLVGGLAYLLHLTKPINETDWRGRGAPRWQGCLECYLIAAWLQPGSSLIDE